MLYGVEMKTRNRYQWQRLIEKGDSVCVRWADFGRDKMRSARTAALKFAERNGFTVAIWRTKAANLMVERTS